MRAFRWQGRWQVPASAIALVGLLGACASVPDGPSVTVVPGSGKTFDQFRLDDKSCRQFASDQVGGKTANEAALQNGVAGAAIGTAVGAAAGALFNGSSGAANGAGAGLLVGTLVGSNTGAASAWTLQQRYDVAYMQCMYAKGNQIPTAAQAPARRRYQYMTPPPPPPPAGGYMQAPPPPPAAAMPPAPPAGMPPGPPPGYAPPPPQ
jgi:YMGG-like Gly-zipper